VKLVLFSGCPTLVLFFKKLFPYRSNAAISLTIQVLLFLSTGVFAEGSKELSANGGYRASLFSSTVANASFPFPTQGTMKVYAKAGETIYTGSSAQGMGSGTINLRAPDGKTYTSGASAVVGLIVNRNQELAGPLPNSGGYTPFTVKVQTGQDGVWEIDFISQSNGVDMGNPTPVPANADWTQDAGLYVTAFDISVRDINDSQFINGRVFTNVFSGILGTFNVGFNGIFNVLTKDGYQYTLNNNGQAGNGFTFFVNNKGFKNANGTASYKSVNGVNITGVQDPRAADSPTDITHKIFFNPPSSDLPDSAKTPDGGTTWLLNPPATPTISNVTFSGIEGTADKAGTNPLGANFSFTTTAAASYVIAIDINKNGIFTDAIDRKLTGVVNAGVNQVFWDGLDGLGNKVPANQQANYNANITLTTKAGEVHFPFFDVERNINGIILTRFNGNFAPDDTVYWDDTPISIVGTPSNPIQNLTGIKSSVNGHKWGVPASNPLDDQDFGNNKSIDTWSYISSAPLITSVSFQLQEADLEIDSIVANAGCAGQPVSYTVTVKNNGPSDVAGAKFRFNFPAVITDVNVSSTSTSGTSSVTAGAISANAYDADVDLANGSVRTFTITGIIAQTATGSLNVSASVLRPADVTDPDATNPDAAPPVDPLAECNSLPSGAGCNNIKTNTTSFKPAPGAGPDQKAFQYAPVTLAATGEGTWTQAPGGPATAIITNPISDTTTVAGLNSVGVYHFVFTNPFGCTDTVAITVAAAGTVIPNIFTPNNDGKNDVFKITDLESYPGSQLLIFNRWGNEVYRADNYLNNWDGSGLAEGTYYYILNRRERTGGTTVFKGWVFLKRSK